MIKIILSANDLPKDMLVLNGILSSCSFWFSCPCIIGPGELPVGVPPGAQGLGTAVMGKPALSIIQHLFGNSASYAECL